MVSLHMTTHIININYWAKEGTESKIGVPLLSLHHMSRVKFICNELVLDLYSSFLI